MEKWTVFFQSFCSRFTLLSILVGLKSKELGKIYSDVWTFPEVIGIKLRKSISDKDYLRISQSFTRTKYVPRVVLVLGKVC